MKINTSRNYNIELLRILLMFMICLWHLICHRYNVHNHGLLVIENNEIKIFLSSFFIVAVDCFIFISGFFSIKLSLKKILNFEMMAFFALFLSNLFLFSLREKSLNLVIKNFMNIPFSSNWWFFKEYILLMLVAPFINFMDKLLPTKKQQLLFTLIFICYFSIIKWMITNNNGSSFSNFLSIYIIGRYLSKYHHTIRRPKMTFFSAQVIFSIIVLFIIGLYHTNFCSLFLNQHSALAQRFITKASTYTDIDLTPTSYMLGRLLFHWYDYSNPFLLFLAISLFYLFKDGIPTINKSQMWIPFLSTDVFMVYLLTEAINPILYPSWAAVAFLPLQILYIITVFLFCIFMGKLYNYIFQFLFTKIKL